jgi:RNA polymerase sigma-70 factor (TIGR02943 family)
MTLVARPSPTAAAVATAASADFGAAVSAHRPYLIRFASRRLRDAALVEDVVQETLLAALQQSDRFEQRAALRTWLTGILQRRIADSVRRHSRRTAPGVHTELDEAGTALDTDVLDDGAAGSAEPIDWLDPQRRLESRQFVAALSHCLAQLPPAAARLFTLREIDGLSNEEAANELGLSQRDSAVMLHRARTRLRAGLAPHAAVGVAA